MALYYRRSASGAAFSNYAAQFFQSGIPPYYEQTPSLHRPLLYMDNSIDQMAALGIWKTVFSFMQNVQAPPRFRYQGQSRLVFKDAIKEIQDIYRFERASFVQSRLLSSGPGPDSSNLEKVHFIVGLGIIRESLRNEIICQIVKQCIGNPSEVSVSRGWILLALTLGCFAPSEKLVRCLVSFFREENTDHSKFCEQLLTRTLRNGPRKQPPSYMELKAANTLHMIPLPVAFMDGSVKDIEVDAQVTGKEMRAIIAKKIGLADQFGFSIFCAVENNVSSIGAGGEHVMDYVSQCEQFRKESGHSERSPDWKIYFAKELFAPWHDPAEDKVSTDLIYYQVIRGIKHGEYKCETKQELAEIAANEYFITHGSHLDRGLLMSLLPSYLPDKALEGEGTLDKWADLVQDAFNQVKEYYDNESDIKIKQNIVSSARIKWPFVFSRSFDVRQVSGPALPSRSVVLTITWKGVHIFDNYENILMYLRYRDIVKIESSGSRRKDVFVLYTSKKGNFGFFSEHASAVRDILMYIWDGLKRRSRYCVALYDYPPAQVSQLSFRRGDIIVMDENYNGETLNNTGWASGTNDRTKKWGNFTAKSVYVVPVVYVQSLSKPAANKPTQRLFIPQTTEEPTTSNKAEIDDLMSALENKDVKLRSVEGKVVQLESELNQLGREKQQTEMTLKSEKQTFQSTLERKETILVNTRNELEDLRQYNNQASAKLSDMQKNLRDQEVELETLRNQRYTQLSEIKDKESALFTNRARLVELERQFNTANTEVEDLRSRVQEKEEELLKVRQEQHQNILLITEMEGSLNGTRRELETFERQQSEAAMTIKDMRKTIDTQEGSITTLRSERDAHFSELQNKEMLLSNTRSELMRLKEENNDAIITIRELKEKTRDQEEELHMMRLQRTEQNSVTTAQIQELERSVEEKNIKISYLMEERDKNIEKHREEIRDLERRLTEISTRKVVEISKPVFREEVRVTTPTVVHPPKSRIYTLETYARDNFTDNMTWVHQKEPISQPLHKILLRNQAKKERATETFKLILMYMEEIPGKRTLSKIELTDEIFGPALDDELIRDEIYCQLIKQLTFNSNWTSEKKCWELLWLCTGLFGPPSLALTRYVELFLKSSGKPRGNECLSRLERVNRLGARRAPPHYMETEAVVRENSTLFHKFLLPDENEVTVEVESLSKPPSILRNIAQKLNLKTSEGFGIFVRVNQQVLGMADTEYLFDFLWLLASLGTPDSPNGIDYELYVTKKVWTKTVGGEDVIADRIFHYHQELPRYILGYHKCSLNEAVEVSGLAYRVYHGEGARPSDDFPDLLDDIVPRTFRNSMNESQWVQSIMAEHRKSPGMTKDEAKVAFLKKMQSWPTFGSVFFEARQEISQEFPAVVYVAINKQGINVINQDTKDVLKNYPYSLISHWRSGDETFEVIIGGTGDGKRIVFRTHLDYEMDDLLTSYVAFYSDEKEAEQLNALWSQTVREILRKQITFPQENGINSGQNAYQP
ncbi:unconventional myosin-VIIa-like [Dendronephthya gigantea]|uniref:unconventional myosin-VIIa-like n=1 Tax=Dendronephthya gigantea TaxID=151771 RepID=UPI00106C603F|nr:unconventional myosin-VIIa-like [Dendronephthya gigantea]